MYLRDQELRKMCAKLPSAEQLKKSKMNELKKKKIMARASTLVLFGDTLDNSQETKSINE